MARAGYVEVKTEVETANASFSALLKRFVFELSETIVLGPGEYSSV